MSAPKVCERCGCQRYDKSFWLLKQGWVCVIVNGSDIWTCSGCADTKGNK